MAIEVKETEDITAIKHFRMNNEPFLKKQLMLGMEFFNDPYVRIMVDLRTPRQLPKYVAGKGWRPINTNVEASKVPQGIFSERSITPRTSMKILELIPEQFRPTYLATQLAANAKDYPGGFAQFFWEAQNAQSADEINDNIYFGKDPDSISNYASGSTYTTGNIVKFVKETALGLQFFKATGSVSTGETPTTHPAKWTECDNECLAKGWGTLIAELYSSLPTANKHTTGTITEEDAVDQFNEMHFSLPEKLRRKQVIYFCSQDTWDTYKTCYDEKYPNDKLVVENQANITAYLRKTDRRAIIHPVSWMHGSGRIIACPPETLVAGTDIVSDFSSIGKIVETLHGYRTIQKAILGFEFCDLECLHVNDVA